MEYLEDSKSYDTNTTSFSSFQKTPMVNPPTTIDKKNNKYPYCIVWTPIPLISHLFPMIGHTGICTSQGIIHDFSASYTITIDDMAFGKPQKYVMLEPDEETRNNWDLAIKKADVKYSGKKHIFYRTNCHTHVACALNIMGYKGKTYWNTLDILKLIALNSKYIRSTDVFRTYIGIFVIIILMFVLIIS